MGKKEKKKTDVNVLLEEICSIPPDQKLELWRWTIQVQVCPVIQQVNGSYKILKQLVLFKNSSFYTDIPVSDSYTQLGCLIFWPLEF